MNSAILASAQAVDGSAIVRGGVDRTYVLGETDIQCVCESEGTFVSTSVSGKRWKLPPEIHVDSRLVEACANSALLAKILIRRGIRNADEAAVFLDPASYNATSPMELEDMPRAIVRITQAIAEKQRITVYGDYDVDGITGTAVLTSVLRRLGADVDYYIPNRMSEGYGLNLKAVSVLASKHRTKLIITCDCGISNFAEINFARSLGVDTIVLDHHSMPDLWPPAVAILHPKRLAEDHPLHHLPGVGVAYKLCEALLCDRELDEEAELLLDFVTLGMIADMVPLLKENRYLVQIGMPRLVSSPRPGIKALLAQVKGTNGADLVGFGLAPRLNAVGRLSDAQLAVELLTTQEEAVAEKIARRLQLENARRQELCEQIMHDADQTIAARGDALSQRAIVLYKEGWHHGVVGIVASRLVEKYRCPVFIGEIDREQGIVKGSARSVDGVDLYEVLRANEQLLLKWGGHKMAAGFSVEIDKAETFSRAIADTVQRMSDGVPAEPVLEIDAVVAPEEVTESLSRLLERLAPFGMANKKPLLVMRRLTCAGVRVLGKDCKHHRIMLADRSGRAFESVFWNSRGKVPDEGRELDVAFSPEMNEYNGRARLQLVLSDWKAAGDACDRTAVAVPEAVAGQARCAGQAALAGYGASGAGGEGGTGLAPDVVSISASTPDFGTGNSTGSHLPGASSDVRAPKMVPQRSCMEGSAQGNAGDVREEGAPVRAIADATMSTSQTWKDLRHHDRPVALVEAALSKLKGRVAIFGESMPRLNGISFTDRTALACQPHLLLWQFPPSLDVFKSLVERSKASHVYLVGGCPVHDEEAPAFLKRLMGLVRYAVNQRDGKAEGEKLVAAMGSTKIAVALGLSILRKLSIIDWFAEDGFLYLDILDQQSGTPESLAEFRQLGNSLKEVFEFRKWCLDSPVKAIQLAVTPNHVELTAQQSGPRRNDEPDSRRNGTEIQRREPDHLASLERSEG